MVYINISSVDYISQSVGLDLILIEFKNEVRMKLMVYIGALSLIITSCGSSQIVETDENKVRDTEQQVTSTNATKDDTSNSIEAEIARQKNLTSGGSGIEGKWDITVETPRGSQTNTIEIKNIDGQLKAVTANGTFIISEQGDNEYSWENELDTPRGKMTTKNTASINGDKMSGTVEIVSGAMSGRALSFTGARQ